MKSLSRFVAMGLIAAALMGCGPEVEYRYRLAAAVDTPEGVKRASSVIQIEVYKSGGLQRQGSQHFYGEAVPIDLGRRGTLFVLLTSPTDPMTVLPGRSLMTTGAVSTSLKRSGCR